MCLNQSITGVQPWDLFLAYVTLSPQTSIHCLKKLKTRKNYYGPLSATWKMPLKTRVSTGDSAGYVSARWLSPSWRVEAEYTDIQDHFNAEVGFVPRVGIRTSRLHGEWDPRPGRWGIRQFDPMWNVTYNDRPAQSPPDAAAPPHDRYLLLRMGRRLSFWYNDLFEQLDLPFLIRPDVTIPAGTYRFGQWMFRYRSDPSRRLFGEVGYQPQTFFDGTRRDVSGTLGVRITSSIAAEGRFSRSDVDLPGGAFMSRTLPR